MKSGVGRNNGGSPPTPGSSAPAPSTGPSTSQSPSSPPSTGSSAGFPLWALLEEVVPGLRPVTAGGAGGHQFNFAPTRTPTTPTHIRPPFCAARVSYRCADICHALVSAGTADPRTRVSFLLSEYSCDMRSRQFPSKNSTPAADSGLRQSGRHESVRAVPSSTSIARRNGRRGVGVWRQSSVSRGAKPHSGAALPHLFRRGRRAQRW